VAGTATRSSRGSAIELDYHLLRARDLGFLAEMDHALLAGELKIVKRMLANFIGTLSADS
jgi:four helix bundle protein